MTSQPKSNLDINSSYPFSYFSKEILNCVCGPIIVSFEVAKISHYKRQIGILSSFSNVLSDIHRALEYSTNFRIVDSMPSSNDIIEVSVSDNTLTYPVPNLSPIMIKFDNSCPDMKFFLQLDRHFVNFYLPA